MHISNFPLLCLCVVSYFIYLGITRSNLLKVLFISITRYQMETVGLSLQRSAIEMKAEPTNFDQFGRSAFNRYYYAVFLIVRELILEFNPTWGGTHSSIPAMLTGSVKREIKSFQAKAQRTNDAEAIALCSKAVAALAALASMIKTANAVRVTADYNPDIKISGVGSDRFSLGAIDITDAHAWTGQARSLSQVIRRAWSLSRGT